MQDLTGTDWGRFEIIQERGRGGMAVVYKANDGVLRRTVALKVLLPQLAANEEFTRRFQREAITAANLRHPGIVVIYDVGSFQKFQYIVMEYLEGPTLQQEIQRVGALKMERVLSITRQLAGALDYAHRKGLVHRDVKPANVIIGTEDHVTLTDFGLVKAARGGKITGEGVAIGTLKYMSPEQAASKEIDSRSDVYSLGVIVYEMLSGQAPFTGTTPYETLNALLYRPPPPLPPLKASVSRNVEAAVMRAMAKEPDQRFATAGEFAQALGRAAGARTPTPLPHDTDVLEREMVLMLLSPGGREFPVYRGSVTVGRDAANGIVIANHQVSRHHAQIRCGREGCQIVDQGSTNGTSVNGALIPARQPHPLRPGDVLAFGPVSLLVTQPSAPSPGGSQTAVMKTASGTERP
ncbi:MAG: FHA domain-containing serine/threonine-protein kinase [Anaerolineae bacterium]|jgi:serine/threonine protein kinase